MRKKLFKLTIEVLVLVHLLFWGWNIANGPHEIKASSSKVEIIEGDDEETEEIREMVEEELGLSAESTKETQHTSIIVTGTVYCPVKGQCDSSPLITADMSKIELTKLAKGELRWIAVSRDLLKKYQYGQKVYIEVPGKPELNGVWEIHDTMNKRFSSRIDFLQPVKGGIYGKWDGIKIREI